MKNHSLLNDGANLSWLDKVVWVLTLQAKRWRTYDAGVFAAKLLVAGTILMLMAITDRLVADMIGSGGLMPSQEWASVVVLVALYALVATITQSADTLSKVELPESERRVYSTASWTAVILVDIIVPLIWA